MFGRTSAAKLRQTVRYKVPVGRPENAPKPESVHGIQRFALPAKYYETPSSLSVKGFCGTKKSFAPITREVTHTRMVTLVVRMAVPKGPIVINIHAALTTKRIIKTYPSSLLICTAQHPKVTSIWVNFG